MSTEPRSARERIVSIDVLRGLVMAVMLLDHTRDFVHSGAQSGDPLDLATTTYPLYFTRWVTHFCAPVFVFLAGTSARLRTLRGASTAEMSRYLATRGLWLVALELVVMRPLIWFNFDYSLLAHLQVIWAIGAAMLVLSLLVFLPLPAIAAVGLAIVAGHNALDGFTVTRWNGPGTPAPNAWEIVWMLLHQRGAFPIGGSDGPVVLLHYPALAWIGTIACGYAFGQVFAWEPARRRRALLALGGAMVALFVALRWSNVYGDPQPWSRQSSPGFTLLSFLDTQKYPPSLLYLAMTLGPAMLALAWLDGRNPNWLGRRLLVLGRVPLFFYVLQWPSAHLASKLLQRLGGQPTGWDSALPGTLPTAPGETGFSLPVVYATWAVLLFLLYPLCAWYARFRRERPQWRWLTYL